MITNVEATLAETEALASTVFRCSGADVRQVSLARCANEVGVQAYLSVHNELIFKNAN